MNGKIGNQTNSQDPQAVNSRVFVGNLNTFQCTKPDVEGLFQKYGRIAGISMHKGYAFIQFTNPFDARSACLGEDGRAIWDQTLDVNLVAEPKPIHTGRKRHSALKTFNPNDCLKLQLESIYRNYYSQLGFPTPRLVPPIKRPRFRVTTTTTTNDTKNHSHSHNHSQRTPETGILNNSTDNDDNDNESSKKLPQINTGNGKNLSSESVFSDLKTYSTPDILICGNCREMFSEILQLVEHKRTYCKLRFTCKCHVLNGYVPPCSYSFEDTKTTSHLLCSQCKNSFKSAWDLMVHVQSKHLLNIYQLNNLTSKSNQNQNQEIFSIDNNNADKSILQFSGTTTAEEDENEMMKGESSEENNFTGTDIESCCSTHSSQSQQSYSIDSGEVELDHNISSFSSSTFSSSNNLNHHIRLHQNQNHHHQHEQGQHNQHQLDTKDLKTLTDTQAQTQSSDMDIQNHIVPVQPEENVNRQGLRLQNGNGKQSCYTATTAPIIISNNNDQSETVTVSHSTMTTSQSQAQGLMDGLQLEQQHVMVMEAST